MIRLNWTAVQRLAIWASGWAALITLPASAQHVAATGLVTEYESAPRQLIRLLQEPPTAAVSPDGALLATGTPDGSVLLWRTADGRPVRRMDGHTDIVSALAFSDDGLRLASASYDDTVRVWLIETGEAVGPPHSGGGRLTSVALSSDGSQVAAAGYDKVVQLWSVAEAADGITSTASFATIRALAFRPDGAQIAVGDDSGTLALLSAADLSELRRTQAHAGAARSVRYSPRGDVLLSGGDDGTVADWYPQSLERRPNLSESDLGHESPVTSLAFSSDERLVASGDEHGHALVWDLASGEVTSSLSGHQDRIAALGFLPDAQALLTASLDRSVNLWRSRLPLTPRLAVIDDIEKRLWTLRLSADGGNLLAGGTDGFLAAWDVTSGRRARDLTGYDSVVDSLDISPDGRRIAVCSWRRTGVALFDLETGALPVTHETAAYARSVRFSPDGQWLAAGTEDGTLYLWPTGQTGEARTISTGDKAVYDVAFSPDGTWLAACGGDWRQPAPGFIRLWRTSDWSQAAQLTGHEHAVRAVSFNSAGTQLASAAEDGQLIVWDLASLSPAVRLQNSAGARPLAFSPDGTQVAAGLHDGTIAIWDMARGEVVRRFQSEDDPFGLAYSAEGDLLFSTSGEPRIEIWPVRDSGSTIESIRGWVP
jgi:WD40 repeat protein